MTPAYLCRRHCATLAEGCAFGLRWSPEILDEVERALVRRGVSSESASRRIDAMHKAFPWAEVQGCSALAPQMTNESGNHHVLAAAVLAGSDTIITANLKHFTPDMLKPWNVEAVHPDVFLLNQLDLSPNLVRTTIERQAADYVNPEMTVRDLLATLSRSGATHFAAEARRQWLIEEQ